MNKIKSILEIIACSNFIVITDITSIGSVSPLYAEKFREKLSAEDQRLELIGFNHSRNMEALADELLLVKKGIGDE